MKHRYLMQAAATAFSIVSGVTLAQNAPAYFAFEASHQQTRLPHEFVFAVTDPITIQQIRDMIRLNDYSQGSHILGRIVTTRADYNEEWPFHFDPDTVRVFRNATEQCDADPFLIEANLNDVGSEFQGRAFLKDNEWCPWSSRVTREVKYP